MMESGLVLDFRHPRNAPCRGLANVLSVPPDPPSPLVPTQTFWAYCPISSQYKRLESAAHRFRHCCRGFVSGDSSLLRRRGAPSTSGCSRSAKSRCPGAPFLTTHRRTHKWHSSAPRPSAISVPITRPMAGGAFPVLMGLSSPVLPAALPRASCHLISYPRQAESSELQTALCFRSNCPNRHLPPATVFIPPLGLEVGSQMTCRIPKEHRLNLAMKRGHFKSLSRTPGKRFACRKNFSGDESTTEISLG